jgi:hypothetical protein
VFLGLYSSVADYGLKMRMCKGGSDEDFEGECEVEREGECGGECEGECDGECERV